MKLPSVNKFYLKENNLQVKILSRGSVWLDTGTITSLHQANTYVKVIKETRKKNWMY